MPYIGNLAHFREHISYRPAYLEESLPIESRLDSCLGRALVLMSLELTNFVAMQLDVRRCTVGPGLQYRAFHGPRWSSFATPPQQSTRNKTGKPGA